MKLNGKMVQLLQYRGQNVYRLTNEDLYIDYIEETNKQEFISIVRL